MATITDNGTNFVKEFKEFNVRVHHQDEEGSESTKMEDAREEDDNDLTFLSPYSELANEQIVLPHHLRCASHALNLLAITDVAKVVRNSSALAKINHTTMGKCSALWSAWGKPKSSDIIRTILGCQLRYPCPTRWNSLHDSIKLLLEKKDKLYDVMTKLNLPLFKDAEIKFLEEYTATLQPLATGLDRLQSEKHCFYGDLLPTLLMMLSKLKEVEPNDIGLRVCRPLLAAVVSGFKTRFSKFLSLDPEVTDAVMASVSHPYFKLRWIAVLKLVDSDCDQATLESSIKAKFYAAVNKFGNSPKKISSEFHDTSLSDDFFNYLDSSLQKDSPEMQAMKYLQDNRSTLQSLDDYPAVKSVFIRYNTALPSSAPVERLFSFAGMIHSPKRGSLSDTLFEQLVLMKGNSCKFDCQ